MAELIAPAELVLASSLAGYEFAPAVMRKDWRTRAED
jgi:hypothetical protein